MPNIHDRVIVIATGEEAFVTGTALGADPPLYEIADMYCDPYDEYFTEDELEVLIV